MIRKLGWLLLFGGFLGLCLSSIKAFILTHKVYSTVLEWLPRKDQYTSGETQRAVEYTAELAGQMLPMIVILAPAIMMLTGGILVGLLRPSIKEKKTR